MSETIKYYLTPIHLEGFEDHFRAVIIPDGTFTLDDMVEELKKRNLGVPTNLIKPMIEMIFQVRDEQLAKNYNVHLGDTHYALSAPGRFEHSTDIPKLAKVNAVLRGGSSQLRSPSWERITERIDTSVAVPHFLDDGATGESNSLITPNNIAKLRGIRLDFDKNDKTQGVFFINDDTKAEYPAQVYSEIRPAQVQFLTPALPAGSYTLELRSKAKENGTLKKGLLQAVLEVATPQTEN